MRMNNYNAVGIAEVFRQSYGRRRISYGLLSVKLHLVIYFNRPTTSSLTNMLYYAILYTLIK